MGFALAKGLIRGLQEKEIIATLTHYRKFSTRWRQALAVHFPPYGMPGPPTRLFPRTRWAGLGLVGVEPEGGRCLAWDQSMCVKRVGGEVGCEIAVGEIEIFHWETGFA